MALVVDTSVPYGNACDVCVTREASNWTVTFAADPHGGPETLWFAFGLRHEDGGDSPVGPVKLVLKHFGNMLGGARAEDFCPVLCLPGRDWERMPAGCTETLPDGRSQAAWTLDVPAGRVDVAACYPYGLPEVEALVGQTGGYWRADTIGVSQAGRPLVRLSNAPGAAGDDRPGVYVMARQHSGETPGSYVLDGFLRELAAQPDKAPLVWAVPLGNIDGVEQGDYGKDNFPYDLNRAWGSPPMRHEVLVFQRDIGRWRKRCRPLLAMDFHAPGMCETDGCYLFLPSSRTFPGMHEAAGGWGESIGKALAGEYAAASFCRTATYASRWEMPTFTAYFAAHGICSLSMETPYSRIGQKALTRQDYRQIGRRVAQAVIARIGG